MDSIKRFRYVNSTDGHVLIILEPWAEQFSIAPGQEVDVIVDGGASDEELEIESTPAGLILYGWTGSAITLSTDGKELDPITQA